MKYFVLGTTILAGLVGVRLGYGAGGVGGAILYGAFLGLGGVIMALFAIRTARLFRPAWPLILLVTILIVLSVLSWGVYF